jgi:hypothetical protein
MKTTMKTLPVFALLTVALTSTSAVAQTAAAYQSAINSESPSHYFTLDNTLTDSAGGAPALNAFSHTFTTNLWGNSSAAAAFHVAGDILTNSTDLFSGGGTAPNPGAAGTGSMSLLLRTLSGSPTGQRWVFSQSSSFGTANQFSLFFDSNTASSDPGALKLVVGDTTNTILSASSISFKSWYYFGITYDESRDAGEVRWYLGLPGGPLNSGTLNMGNSAVVGDNFSVSFGNRVTGLNVGFAGPGDGGVDEIAIWNRELSSAEITSQFIAIPEPFCGTLLVLGLALGVKRWQRRRTL